MSMQGLRNLIAFCELFGFFWLLIPGFCHALKFWDGVIFSLCLKWKARTWRKRRDEWGEWM